MCKPGKTPPLPISYYKKNSDLAEQIMAVVLSKNGEMAEKTINRIKKITIRSPQMFMGEPTFARAVSELIERTHAEPEEKLKMIVDISKITILLECLKCKIDHIRN